MPNSTLDMPRVSANAAANPMPMPSSVVLVTVGGASSKVQSTPLPLVITVP